MTSRHLQWDGCVNTRDLGGILVTGGSIRPGSLIRSDSLSQLTTNGWEQAGAYGVATVIDLRSTREVERHPVRPPDGIAYVHSPIVEAAPETTPWNPALTWQGAYETLVDTYRAEFAAAVTAVAAAQPGGVAVHCRVGRDRTGVLVALLLEAAGARRHHVAEDYAASAIRLAPLFAALLEDERDARHRARIEWEAAAPPEGIHDVLAYVQQRYGDVRSYLTADSVEAAVSRLLS